MQAREARDLERRLLALSWRVQAGEALRSASLLLPFALLALCAHEVLGRLLGWRLSGFGPAAGLALGAVALWSVAAACFRRPTAREMALLVDRRLRSHEMVTAALHAGDESPLRSELLARAAPLVSDGRARHAFPLTGWRAWKGAGTAVLALAILPVVPIRQTRARTLAAAQSEGLKRAGAELARSVHFAEARRRGGDLQERRSLERLRRLAEQMRRGELATPEEALVALERLERSLRSGDARARDGAAAPASLPRALGSLARDAGTADLAHAMESGARGELEKALAKMAGALPAEKGAAEARREELRRVAERFESLASALAQAGRSEEAAVLREIAEALGKGDVEAARRLLESRFTLRACENAGKLCREGESGRELAELVQLARVLAGGGAPLPLGKRAGIPDGGGRNGPSPGVGSTNEAQGGYRTGSPIVRDRRSAETSDGRGTYEALHDSRIAKAGSWKDFSESGRAGDAGPIVAESSRGLGVKSRVALPASFASDAAPGSPEKAGDLEKVPIGYREIVRRYFAPEGEAKR